MSVNPQHRRTEIILFRATVVEREQIEKAAAGSRSVSDWLREVVLSSCAAPRRLDKAGAAKEGDSVPTNTKEKH